MEWWKEPFFQVALPIVFALLLNNFYIGKRIDDLRDQLGKRIDDLRDHTNKRFDDVNWRIDELHKDVREIKGIVQAQTKTSPF